MANLPKSLTQPFRKNQLIVGGGFRGFFAAYNAALAYSQTSSTLGPAVLDLQVQGPFNENAPPTGYTDLGWIDGFKITPSSKVGMVRSGYRGAVRAIYRGEVSETFDFMFKEMSRMAMKISRGVEVFNLLSNPGAVASTLGPLSSSGAAAVPLGVSGYNASFNGNPTLFVAAGSGALFAVNQYIVCDDDYNTTQFGSNVGPAGVPIYQNAVTDVDYIRKTSDFVARIVAITPNIVGGQDGLILNKAFVGGGNALAGTPPTGPDAAAKIQVIKGYAAREGGTYVTEWSALFVCGTVDGSQIAIYYPHAAISAFKGLNTFQLEDAGTTSEAGHQLETTMMAMAYDDPIDGETVVSYAAYYPSSGKDPAI